MKDLKKKTTHQLAFSLILDSDEVTSLDFVAPDEEIFDYWTDGINAILGKSFFFIYFFLQGSYAKNQVSE